MQATYISPQFKIFKFVHLKMKVEELISKLLFLRKIVLPRTGTAIY